LYKSKGGDIQNIENEIELSDHLKLIIDLDNKEKHCKLNNSRSGKYPYLDEVDRALSVMTNQDIQSSSFSVNPFTGQFEANGGVGVTLSAEIKDNNGIIICSLDELIDKSIKDWEKIIKKFNLISK